MITIETAGLDDLPELIQLLGILFSEEAEFKPDAAKQEAALRLILSDPARGRVCVARDGARVVAMASLLFTVSTAEGGRAALFEDLIVRPQYRGRGIGAKLLEHVIGEARTAGVLRITLLTEAQNERAQALYRKLGFKKSAMQPMRLHLREEK